MIPWKLDDGHLPYAEAEVEVEGNHHVPAGAPTGKPHGMQAWGARYAVWLEQAGGYQTHTTHLVTAGAGRLDGERPVEGRADVVRVSDIVVLVEQNSGGLAQAAGNRPLRMTSQETLDGVKALISEYPAGQELEAAYRDCRQHRERLDVSGM